MKTSSIPCVSLPLAFQSSSWFRLSVCSRVWLTQLAWATIHLLSMSAWLTEKCTFIPPKHRVLFFFQQRWCSNKFGKASTQASGSLGHSQGTHVFRLSSLSQSCQHWEQRRPRLMGGGEETRGDNSLRKQLRASWWPQGQPQLFWTFPPGRLRHGGGEPLYLQLLKALLSDVLGRRLRAVLAERQPRPACCRGCPLLCPRQSLV